MAYLPADTLKHHRSWPTLIFAVEFQLLALNPLGILLAPFNTLEASRDAAKGRRSQ